MKANDVRRAALCGLLMTLAVACTTPGAIAPSTAPIPPGAKVVELGASIEEASSCGYTVLFIPVKNPQPVSTLIESLVKSRGGDALIEVSSSSSMTFYLVGVSHCVEIRGKVVNVTR